MTRRVDWDAVRDLAVVIVGVVLVAVALVDDTLPGWLIRLGEVGAAIAGLGVLLGAVHRTIAR